ncbi:MAG TPA: hypothetical protein VK588_08625 [Chitinophagaceae bacterium]|nr:hypothetical protein [Chitinophagaceae bacterium]
MKKLMLFFVGILFMLFSSAQLSLSKSESTWNLEAGPVVAVPFQFLHLFNSFGIGVNFAALHPVGDGLSVGARASYSYFVGKKLTGVPGATHYDATNIVNIMAELNYTFDNNVIVGGDLGVGFAIKSGGTGANVAENIFLGYQFSNSAHPVIFALVVNTTHTQKSIGLRGDVRF